MRNRTLVTVSTVALVGFFALGLSPLLEPALGPNLASTTTPSMPTSTLTGNGVLGTVTGLEVHYPGVFYSELGGPGCLNQRHPCLPPEALDDLSFLVTKRLAYRLIPMSSHVIFPNGARVTVTGVLVTPSSLGSVVWQGYPISGDIYVQSISVV